MNEKDMELSTHAPAIRFKGFNREWEEKEFSAIVIRQTKACKAVWLPRVEYEDIISGKGVLNKNVFQKKSSKTGIYFERGDILFGKLRPYLKNWLLPSFEGIAVGDFWVLRASETNEKFIYCLIQTAAFEKAANLSAGSKMPRSDWGLVSKTTFSIPQKFKEQTKIGNYFQQLDTLITQHQQKHNKLLNLKKSLLEKIFPKQGSEVPEIRFKGFRGAWIEKILGEIGSLKNGMNFDKTAMGHGYPFVNLQDVFGKNEVSNNNLGLAFSTANQRKEYSLNAGDILFIRSSVKPEGVGEAAVILKSLENTTYSGFIIRFRPNIEMDANFNRFVYSTTNIRGQILASSTSSANSNINQESLQQIQLKLPCKTEQTKIGNLFKHLDTLLNQHQTQLKKLNNIKQACLAKMFV